jgi:type II secretory pathway component GspD/PulD (secretin)
LGFDWFLGNTLVNNGAIGVQGGTASSVGSAASSASSANPLGTFPGTPPGVDLLNPAGTLIPTSASDQLITSGLREDQTAIGNPNVSAPAVATITGILTQPQFRAVIHAMEQRGSVDLLSAPKVTTESGRQAQVLINEVRTIVAGLNINTTGSQGFATAASTTGVTPFSGVSTPSANYATIPVPLGPTLDVIPYVSADGYSIQMTIIPTIIEFEGYDSPGPFVPQAQAAAGSTLGTPLVAQLPLPKFRVRQVTTSAIVWDGQTVMLGGLMSENVYKIKDKVPILGDLPLFGRLFRSESQSTTKDNLVIFITPTIIDPAGNRVHTDDNLPYNPNTIPPQQTAAQ